MEHMKRETPSKVQRCDIPILHSPKLHKTPIKQNDIRSKHTTYQNNTGCFTVLPSHITPPSGLTKFIGRNPFEAELTNRLHLPMISPTVFTKISSHSQPSPSFTWSIDELALIQPAKIEEFPVQQMCSPDPDVEVKAQAAIDRFFNENRIIPSPWDIRRKDNKINIDLDTPNRPLDDLNSTKELSRLKKDAWSQTVLSLPLNLPQNIEDALKPFFTFTQEQNIENEDVNSSNSSLRRKLFFNHDEGTDNDNESIISLSPVKMNRSMILSCSPPQSGMLVHGTPLKKSSPTMQENDDSFILNSESLTPPNMSPIHNSASNILCKRLGQCSGTSFGLDFTDINTNDIITEKIQTMNNSQLLDLIPEVDNENHIKDECKLKNINNQKTNVCDSVNMDALQECSILTNNMNSDVAFNDTDHNGTSLKILTEIEKISTQESYKRSDTMFSTFDPENISNSVQDTGYQTYSMNSTIHTMDSCNSTSLHQKINSGEQKMMYKDNAQISWKENIKNVFSSTPSKRDNKKES